MDTKKAKMFAVLSAILVLLSMTQVYLIVSHEGITNVVRFYNIPTSLISLVIAVFYLNSFRSKNKDFYKLMNVLLTGCYFLAFHSIYTTYVDDNYLIAFLWTKEIILTFITFATYFLFLVLGKNKEGFKALDVTIVALQILVVFAFITIHLDHIGDFKPGIYLYFASFVPLLINTYLIKEPVEYREPTEKLIKDPIDISDSFVFANYVDGLENDYDLKNNLAVMLNKEDDREIVVGVYKENMEPLRIEYYKIKKIELRREPLLMDIPKRKKDKEIERLSIMGVLLKHFGGEAASDELRRALDEYDELKTDIVNHIVITYEVKKEQKYIHIYTKTDDQVFIETLERTLPFPIERIEN